MTLEDLKSEFRLSRSGDSWGDVMEWLFAIADEAYFNRACGVPEEWKYRPSPMGPSNDPEDYTVQCVQDADDEALMAFGAMLHRAANILKARGMDY